MNKYHLKNVDFVNFLFLALTPFGAIYLIFLWLKIDGFQIGQVLLGVLLYFISGISITAGYHRLFAHKTYSANPIIKFVFLLFGAASFQNSVLKWGSDHRLHHTKVDTDEDPYCIKEGFFYAHMGWIFLKKNSDIKTKYAKDFLSDKLVMWQHKYYIPIAVFIGIILPTFLGEILFHSWIGGLAVGGIARIVLVHHCTFFINSLCHCLGTTPYTDTNSAKDSWFMALFTFGEGYHNFHHYFQVDYRNGIRWYQFDPTKWLIWTLNKLGLAFRLKLTPDEKILAARMQMKLKVLATKISSNEKFVLEVETLKLQVLDALQNFHDLKNQYKEMKSREIKQKMYEARAEFNLRIEAWNIYLRYLNVQTAML